MSLLCRSAACVLRLWSRSWCQCHRSWRYSWGSSPWSSWVLTCSSLVSRASLTCLLGVGAGCWGVLCSCQGRRWRACQALELGVDVFFLWCQGRLWGACWAWSRVLWISSQFQGRPWRACWGEAGCCGFHRSFKGVRDVLAGVEQVLWISSQFQGRPWRACWGEAGCCGFHRSFKGVRDVLVGRGAVWRCPFGQDGDVPVVVHARGHGPDSASSCTRCWHARCSCGRCSSWTRLLTWPLLRRQVHMVPDVQNTFGGAADAVLRAGTLMAVCMAMERLMGFSRIFRIFCAPPSCPGECASFRSPRWRRVLCHRGLPCTIHRTLLT